MWTRWHRWCLLVVIGLSCYADSTAQDTTTVRLLDGSIIKGKLIEDNDYYKKIVVLTGDTVTIGYKNIVTHDIQSGPRIRTLRDYKYKASTHRYDGYFVQTNIGIFLSADDASFTFDLFTGRRMKPNWNLGFGYSRSMNIWMNIYPAFVEFHLNQFNIFSKYYLNDKPVRIFAAGTLGYGFIENNWSNGVWDHTGGIASAISAGTQYKNHWKVGITIELGMGMQYNQGRIDTSNLGWQGQPVAMGNFKSLLLRPFFKVGLEF